jgi:hypothetical protein
MSKKELKIELKELAGKIHQGKFELKQYQKENGGCDGGRYHDIEFLKYEFRHKHIAYCQLRGRTYEQIENHCSDSHAPNFDYIKEIMDGHQEKTIEDVRACA